MLCATAIWVGARCGDSQERKGMDCVRDKVVCHRCFLDKALRKWTKDNGTFGKCPWCRRNGSIVPVAALSGMFRNVASLYEPVSEAEVNCEGDLIGALIDRNWDVFDASIRRRNLAQDLTLSVLHADADLDRNRHSPNYTGFFRPRENLLEGQWNSQALHALAEAIRVPKTARLNKAATGAEDEVWMPLEAAFEELVTHLTEGDVLYRARIHTDRLSKARFESHELTLPPSEYAKANRANQEGDPVLYVATNKSTALAEVRAWRGAVVALAPVHVKRDLRLVDLKQRRRIPSPFFVDTLRWHVQVFQLLHRLGKEMSHPVMPHEEHILYRPTQLLARYIKACGYDGVLYPSAMGSGGNVALFELSDVYVSKVDYIRVKRVACFSEPITTYEDLYDAGPYDHLLRHND